LALLAKVQYELIPFKLSAQRNETETNNIETVLCQFHLVVRTFFRLKFQAMPHYRRDAGNAAVPGPAFFGGQQLLQAQLVGVTHG